MHGLEIETMIGVVSVIRAIDPRESLDASRHLTLDNADYAAATSYIRQQQQQICHLLP